ncbi:hypothetical protein HJC23_003677 [Cyclotella cryptica]|uniref:Sodium/bile acid cotransporter n=1 Tax=Cyclotella cryptica TaxID=29204 RepID=A0ABD3QLS7_9STRA|eukprot:CCRYP_004970-RA/>CCRYP_004970-RA protein AED:0.06 eAED:0.06 QI:130/1/1/1/0.66/0.75/4/613/427
MNNKNTSPSASICSFVAVVALIIASSALPVKSDAFAIVCSGNTSVMSRKMPNARPRTIIYHRRFAQIDSYNISDEASHFSKFRGGESASLPFLVKMNEFVSNNFFLIGMIVAVSFAKIFPELGKNGSVVRPELFIGKYGVTTIFLLSGLSLKLKELANAAANMKLNGLIQMITFGAWPFLVGLPLTKGIRFLFPQLLPAPLLDGLLILCCLPTTINMCILLTSAAGGSVATALCNAVISNLTGIFLTPALLLHFFGKSIELPFLDLVNKLCSKVLLPVAIGQALRSTPMKEVYSKHTGFFKRFQEIVLLGIVWNAFCNAFTSGLGLEVKHAVALLTLLPAIHAVSLTSLFSFFRMNLFGFSQGEATAATFCAAHKTLAFGLPLINTIFEGNPHLASYCAPIMFMHPLQLVIGSLLLPCFTEHKKKQP